MLAAKINLSPINQGLTFQFGHLFAHTIQQTPVVKLGKTRVSPFNGAHPSASFGKSADPTCYNVCVGGNHAAALFDIARRMT